MGNKALGIKILKSTALFTVKAVWFLLCKVCLAVLFVMGLVADALSSGTKDDQTDEDHSPLSDMHTQFLMDYGDPNGPSTIAEKPHL